MQTEKERLKKSTVRVYAVLLLVGCLAILIARLIDDCRLYRFGGTFVMQKSSPEGYDYLLRIPRGYNDFAGPQPLLIFLHGSGDTGTDPLTLKDKDPVYFSQMRYRKLETSYFPFIVVSPICPERRWEPKRVIATLDQVLAKTRFCFRIDPDRINLTGYSMGGFGTIETAMEFPDRFAAIVPVAGGGEPARAEKLRGVAAWFFHGREDTIVPLPSSERLVDAMRKNGHPDVRLTVIREGGHVIVREVYANPELYDWLLLKRKSRHEENKPSDSFDDGAGGDSGDLVEGGAAGKDLAEPVVPEELHAE